MATTAPTWSRPHRPGAGDVQRTGIYSQIVDAWIHMSRLPSMPAMLHKWGKAHPVLADTASLPDLLDRIDAAGADETDQILLALISLAQGGKEVPRQVVLQAMLPKLSRMAHSANRSGTDAADLEDRRHIGVCTLFEVLLRYPTERRPRHVAANLALDTLHELTASTRKGAAEYPVSSVLELGDDEQLDIYVASESRRFDPTSDTVTDNIGDSPNPDGSLFEVVAWGVDEGKISSEDASLLVQVYAPGIGEPGGHAAVADQLGLKPEAVRQRCSRASRALAAAVRTSVDGSWLDSPNYAVSRSTSREVKPNDWY